MMYQPTEYQKSIFKIDEFDVLEIKRDLPMRTAKIATQYVIAKYAFIVEQLELGKIVIDAASGDSCAGCAYVVHYFEDLACWHCPVEAPCDSYVYERYCQGAGRNLYYARRVLAMLQRHYERMFG